MRKLSIIMSLTTVMLFSPSMIRAQQSKNTLKNADVIEMVKAGLPENTIILAIQKSKPNFDTSTKALIELKKQGVSQKILEVILQPQPKQSMPQNTSGDRPPFAQPPQLGEGDETSFMAVTLIDGKKRISMKYSQPNIRISNGMVFNPFGKVKSKTTFNGSHAQLRISNATPEFEIVLPNNMNPSDQLVLIKFDLKSDQREVEVARAGGFTGASTGFRKESIVPTTFKEEPKVQNFNNGMKSTLYRVKVLSPLPPGEYAFVLMSSYYDFGID